MDASGHAVLDAVKLDCIAALYDRHYRSLYQFARHLTKNRADTEDVLQEVFLQLSVEVDAGRLELRDDITLPLAPAEIASSHRLRVWLFRAVIHRVFDLFRERSRRCGREDRLQTLDPPSRPVNPEQALEREENLQRALVALNCIDKQQRDVLVLRCKGFGYQEIADALAISENSVGPTLQRAQAAFKKAWESLSYAAGIGWRNGHAAAH